MSKEFLSEGDKVKLNVRKIKSHPDWKILEEPYRVFVESNSDTVFTVEYDRRRREKPALVCLREDPVKWLFWDGNLLVQDKNSGKFKPFISAIKQPVKG